MPKNQLLIGTRKGLIVYTKSDGDWELAEHHFLGIPVSLAYVDERNGTWWACLDHGHWGVKLHRSKNAGKDWEEVSAPAYGEGMEVKEGIPASSRYLWAIQHGGTTYPNRIWIGTEPGGLFKSEDNGDSFQLVESLWNHPSRENWFGGGRDHAGIHSILIDPRNNDHITVGVSVAGVFESEDGGETWVVRNKGLKADFLPNPDSEIGQDPHIIVASTANPDVMYQQNHCGIFLTRNGGELWHDITEKEGPANFGFACAVDNKNPERAWVVPGVSDEIRVAVNQKLCVCRTDDGGKTWTAFRKGLPQEGCYDIVYRHSLDVDGDTLCFGSTCGNLFISDDAGENWRALNHFLPMVYSVHFAS